MGFRREKLMRALGALIELLTIMSDVLLYVFGAVVDNFMSTRMVDLLELIGHELARRLVFLRFSGEAMILQCSGNAVRRSWPIASITDGS